MNIDWRFILIVACWALIAVGLYLVYRQYERSTRVRKRLLDFGVEPLVAPRAGDLDAPDSGIPRMLFLAGYRAPGATLVFVSITVAMLILGIGVALALQLSGLVGRAADAMNAFPGNALSIFSPVVKAAPWFLLVLLAVIPWLVVRWQRRQRMTEVEQDLPVVFELLATLAEAGLSFDAALDRVIRSQPPGRPLNDEFHTFQSETLSGRARPSCFRRLAHRVDVPTFNVFVSAVLQAEQTGAGIADVLRRQAVDLRQRRRERALEFSMSLPVKRLVPMVVCFLPGLLLAAIGPSMFKLIQTVTQYTQQHGGLFR